MSLDFASGIRLYEKQLTTILYNNQTRMNYPAYRKQGLLLTSTLIESLSKEMSYRVKGSDKFWNNPQGANHILAIKAAALSEDGRLYTKI